MADQDIFREGDSTEEFDGDSIGAFVGNSIEAFDSDVLDDLGNDIVSVVDEDGKEHVFEELDRVDLPNGTFVALAPLVGEADEDGDDELILLRVEEEDGETWLSILEDEAEFDKVEKEFSKRLGIPFE